jgi:hypothetical protein
MSVSAGCPDYYGEDSVHFPKSECVSIHDPGASNALAVHVSAAGSTGLSSMHVNLRPLISWVPSLRAAFPCNMGAACVLDFAQ